MSDPFLEAREEMERLREQAHRSADEATEFAARIEQREYTGHSRRREVSVRVGSDGLVRDITFARSAPATSPARLGQALIEAHDRALLLLRDTVDELAAEAFPTSPDLARVTTVQYHEAMPARVDLAGDENDPYQR